MTRLFVPACVFGILLPGLTLGQSLVVGSRSAKGEISFQAVEEFQINLSKKVKYLPEPKANVPPDAIKRLPKSELALAGAVIRNDGSGRLIRVDNSGKTREVVIPENFALKAAGKPADVPGRLTLTLIHSKKTKQSDVLPPETFFAFVTGPSPDRAVLDFVTKDAVFLNLDEQLAAMRGFVASFRTTPSVVEFRASLERKLGSGVAAFEDGGPYKDLTSLRNFGDLGVQAFPGDAPLKGWRDRIVSRIDFVESRVKLLRSLAVAGDWDDILDLYQDFERYQRSFPDVMALRQESLEESARLHAHRARAFELREDHEIAAREAATAQSRDPKNREIEKLLDAEKLRASQLEAQRTAPTRKVLAPGSPQEVRFQRALYNADRAIQDKDRAKAQENIQDAARENPDAPEILLKRAQLLASGDQLSEALPLLDQYDRAVQDPAQRQEGEKVRNQIGYDLQKKKDSNKTEIQTLTKSGEYSKLNDLLVASLKLDPNDPDFLFHGGLVAGALRDTERGKQLLSTYLDRSNSLDGDLDMRDRAWRIRNALNDTKPAPLIDAPTNWMSGRKMAAGAYYCPETLAFQIPIESVTGNKVRMLFTWDKGKLQAIHSTFDDEKGLRAYRALATPGAPEGETLLAPIGNEEGSFYFQYMPNTAQLLGIRTKDPAKAEPSKAAPPVNPSADGFRVQLSRDKTPLHLLDAEGQPALAIPSSPFIDLGIMGMLEGPAGTTIAGNAFFNPFLWDGVHYFTVQYDRQGRADTAQEWGADNLLRFTWDGERLTEIRGFHKTTEMPYYHRTVTYSGTQIIGEEYSINGRSGHIKYVYNGNVLQQVKVENDGKEWIVKPRS